jgi:hypothetical protein
MSFGNGRQVVSYREEVGVVVDTYDQGWPWRQYSQHIKGFSMKVTVAFLSIFMASGLTMVTVYNTLVDAKSWGSDIPASIQTARDYYAHVDPRRFYLVAGPPTVLLAVLTMILFWRDVASLRLLFGASAGHGCFASHF